MKSRFLLFEREWKMENNNKNPANAKRNARQRCMFKSPVRIKSKLTDSLLATLSDLHSLECATGLAQSYWLRIANFSHPLSLKSKFHYADFATKSATLSRTRNHESPRYKSRPAHGFYVYSFQFFSEF